MEEILRKENMTLLEELKMSIDLYQKNTVKRLDLVKNKNDFDHEAFIHLASEAYKLSQEISRLEGMVQEENK